MVTETIVAGVSGLALGIVLAMLFARAKLAQLSAQLEARTSERDAQGSALASARREESELRGQLSIVRAERDGAVATLHAERKSAEEKLLLLQQARADLSAEFRVLAGEVFEEKGKGFVQLNVTSLAQLLTPFHTELTGFRKKVEEVYVAESKDRSALGEQVRILTELNGHLREETTNLTKALKGDSKTQGDWGELILDRLLESAGLIEGEHYSRQESHRGSEGERLIPDVVLSLPNGRQMVIDSKVTLTAYSSFASADTENERTGALSAHLDAVRRHVKGLSEKKYETLYSLTSMDCVVMFMPLEGAFMAAVTNDAGLFEYAWKANVLLVSPSTLLFVVRTIAHMWRQEAQSRNAQEIANRGAALYDKFAGFASDLEKIGDYLGKATGSYGEARRKLFEGPGNLVRQAEMLKELGVKPTKAIPRVPSEPGDAAIESDEQPSILPPSKP
jgi:DNA recombination protein RmuC